MLYDIARNAVIDDSDFDLPVAQAEEQVLDLVAAGR
jgi:hypothetical protein